MRLFLERFLKAGKQPLPNHQTGISIGIATHLALRTKAERCARSIARDDGLSFAVTDNPAMATMTLSARVARVDPRGHDLLVPCLIPGILEDPALHPVGAFAISTARI